MKYLLALVIAFYFCSAYGQTPSVPVHKSYQLGTGDKISILVYGEEDLSFEIRIGMDGVIRFPFLGDIQVIGKTVEELNNIITTGLKNGYLDDPNVNVAVEEYRPFYILGEVVNPKLYQYQPGMTVRQAIAISGGLNERANISEIQIKRKTSEGLKVFGEISLDAELLPGDIITVPQRFF